MLVELWCFTHEIYNKLSVMCIKANFMLLVIFTSMLPGCNGQTDNGNSETSEFTFNGITKAISAIDTSSGWTQKGQKILLTGIAYYQDGITAAPNVLIYYYQTNTEGKYVHKPGEKRSMPPNEQGQTHGYIRGWVKTDSSGRYFIYTVRPGKYPTRDFPSHIHVTIKEPGKINEYYIDDVVFDDDKLLTSVYRKKMENRAGSGVVRLVKKEDSLFVGERNIILGLNIPDYPEKNTINKSSGRNIGEDAVSFTPYHAWGPDKGSKACPVCKYGWYHGILYFVGNNPNWKDIKEWLRFLEFESKKREKYLKVYFVYGNESNYIKDNREKELENLGIELKLEKTALTFVPSFSDTDSDISDSKIDQQVDNTIILYKRSKIIGKFINLKPTEDNFILLSNRLDKTINEYFYLH